MNKPRPWMTVAAAAKYLGLSDATMQKLINHPGFPAYNLANGPVIVLTKALDEWLAASGFMAANAGKIVQLSKV